MRLEVIPLILGILVFLIGLALIVDAWVDPGTIRPKRERRRRKRTTLSSTAQTCIGVGVLCLGFALIGRDTGRFTNVAIIIGFGYLVVGMALSYRYMLDWLTSRGQERRRPEGERTFIGPTTTRPRFKPTPYAPSAPGDDPDLPEDLTIPPSTSPKPDSED